MNVFISEVGSTLMGHELRFLLIFPIVWVVIGLLGLVRPHGVRLERLLFSFGAIVCVAIAIVAGAFLARGETTQLWILPFGLPDLPFHVRLDALSGFFLLLLGLAVLVGWEYWRMRRKNIGKSVESACGARVQS